MYVSGNKTHFALLQELSLLSFASFAKVGQNFSDLQIANVHHLLYQMG